MGKRLRAVATKRLKVARQSVKRLRFIGKRLRAVATKRPKVARQSVKRLRFIGKRLRAVATKRFWRRIYRETGWIWCGVAIMFVRAKIWHIARSGKLIVVGPWLSEVGFEVLYWIPFLN